MFKISVILCCLSVVIFCDDFLTKQHDYDVEILWAELADYNKAFYKHYKISTFKFNRSVTAVNVTWEFKKQLNHSNSYVIVQAYKFLSNEYRIFPMHFQLNFCNVFENNIGGSRDCLRCGNMTDCHLKKDQIYHVCNVHPDKSRFPPFIPTGEYKIEMTLKNNNTFLFVANAYGKAYRPIKMP